jgi:hypothetical protein
MTFGNSTVCHPGTAFVDDERDESDAEFSDGAIGADFERSAS